MKPLARRTLAALLLIAGYDHSALGMPSFNEVKADFRPSDTLILDRHGEILQRQRTDVTVRRGQWVALADVSPALRTALVLSEDQRFYEHSGVDWRAVSSAAWGNLWNTRTRGASTLTMQLAGLLDGDWRAGPGGRSVTQKLGQAVTATQLEARWRKDQILESYLNLVPFRGEIVGIDALSRTLFGKAAHGLDAREAAVAAALVRAPNAAPARVAHRACGVLQAMNAAPATPPAIKKAAPPVSAPAVRSPAADCDGLNLFVTGALQRRAWPASEGLAPHLARRLLATGGPATPTRVNATVDATLQRFALQTLQRHLRELRGRHAQALPLCPGDRRAAPDRRLAAGRRAHADPHRRRPVHPAELRPPVQGLGLGAHRAGRLAQRAGGAHAGDGVARSLRPATARRGPAPARDR